MIEKLNQIGEREILNRLKKFLPSGQLEDDTAQINPYGKEVLINTDVLVEGVHFSNETTSPKDVGWRAIATNISDLACSGVKEILGVTVGIIAPSSTEWTWIEDVYIGLEQALKEFGGQILGGDCSSGKQKVVAITAFGTVGPLRLHRSEAIDGDLLITSGSHGLSRLGLALLLSDPLINTNQLSKELKAQAIYAHQRPQPPLEALRALETCKPNHLSWRAAGTDSSDGLLDAVQNLCASSNCQAILDPNKLPRDKNWPLGAHWDNWCMSGGEDFELVLSLPPEWGKALLQVFPSSKQIGRMQTGMPKVYWNNGKEITNSKYSGFKHFY
ncbi:thiamine-phosphate kinase [Prochlorococcus sp. MIT 1307]|uniref:thiamine-phosphate kinase n=1 Tax=Prochlorococcus sp. MIT 1307 TaxID=3096219 RepID=UPI002A752F7F|nr:thiamine-phosphate kinase [Prochlorococcus sp. MIT 1307]